MSVGPEGQEEGQGIVRIDGSYGEGGGQILRSSLALSALTGRPVEIFDIRAGRKKPGLAAQHLTGCLATAEITGGSLEGAEIGSQRVMFAPGRIRGGDYRFDVSAVSPSAGSTMLVLQAVLPALLFAPGPSRLLLEGGTHVAWSPPFEYVQEVLLPVLAKMGTHVELWLERPGWYPQGGGRVEVEVQPCGELASLELQERGELVELACLSTSSGLPDHVAERQLKAAQERLREVGLAVTGALKRPAARGKGSFCFVRGVFEGGWAGASALGARGKPAERVGREAAKGLLAFLSGGACVDKYLGDQIVPYLALARGRSVVAVEMVTEHLRTNIWVARQLLRRRLTLLGEKGEPGLLIVEPVDGADGGRK
ncbi:MAG: RNA 3'-terminal phosphate cyclase [Armatimonadota bacterium]